MFSNFHNATDFEVYVFIKNTKIHYLEKKTLFLKQNKIIHYALVRVILWWKNTLIQGLYYGKKQFYNILNL